MNFVSIFFLIVFFPLSLIAAQYEDTPTQWGSGTDLKTCSRFVIQNIEGEKQEILTTGFWQKIYDRLVEKGFLHPQSPPMNLDFVSAETYGISNEEIALEQEFRRSSVMGLLYDQFISNLARKIAYRIGKKPKYQYDERIAQLIYLAHLQQIPPLAETPEAYQVFANQGQIGMLLFNVFNFSPVQKSLLEEENLKDLSNFEAAYFVTMKEAIRKLRSYLFDDNDESIAKLLKNIKNVPGKQYFKLEYESYSRTKTTRERVNIEVVQNNLISADFIPFPVSYFPEKEIDALRPLFGQEIRIQGTLTAVTLDLGPELSLQLRHLIQALYQELEEIGELASIVLLQHKRGF